MTTVSINVSDATWKAFKALQVASGFIHGQLVHRIVVAYYEADFPTPDPHLPYPSRHNLKITATLSDDISSRCQDLGVSKARWLSWAISSAVDSDSFIESLPSKSDGDYIHVSIDSELRQRLEPHLSREVTLNTLIVRLLEEFATRASGDPELVDALVGTLEVYPRRIRDHTLTDQRVRRERGDGGFDGQE